MRTSPAILRLALLGLLAALALFGRDLRDLTWRPSGRPAPAVSRSDAAETLAAAFRERRSGFVVETSGSVERLLADDLQGSRHQRFILRLDSGQTLLVAHNINLADRVPIAIGDQITVRGEYEWNERGGLLHWTHRDPDGQHPGGWIRSGGRLYE